MKIPTNVLQSSIGAKAIAAGAAVVIVLMVVIVPATAHSWSETVQDGDYELGINSNPAKPVDGVPTKFTGYITNTSLTEKSGSHRGGIVNETVAVAITGPDGHHHQFEIMIPEDDPYFEFSYVFPTDGQYEIKVLTTIDGKEVKFQFTRGVSPQSAETEAEPSNATNSERNGIDNNVIVLGSISGVSALFALGAFGAAIMAYRGTD